MKWAPIFTVVALCCLGTPTYAITAPSGQIHIDHDKILRGSFVQQHIGNGGAQPIQTTGHFVVTPAYGLLWQIEKPFPTSTIITSSGAAQDMGGLALKLPIRNLQHVYQMVGGALAGDWDALESDFTITASGNAQQWQMILTPHLNGEKPKVPYSVITVSGAHYVDHIVMTKADGSSDAFDFANQQMSAPPLQPQEVALFGEVKP